MPTHNVTERSENQQVITSSPYTHIHFLTSLSVCGFTCLAERYSVTILIKLNKHLEWKGKVIFNIEIRTFVLNLTAIQYAIFVSAGLSQENMQRHLSAAAGNAGRRAWFRFCTLGARRILEVSYLGSNWKEYCVLNDGFYLYKPSMIVFLTLCIPLYWRTNKSTLTNVKNTTL